MSGVHRFDANITASGMGSVLKLDGVEIEEARAFTITADVNGSSLSIELVPRSANKVAGFVDAVTWLGRGYLVSRDKNYEPLKMFWSEEAAIEFISKSGFADCQIDEVPFEINR